MVSHSSNLNSGAGHARERSSAALRKRTGHSLNTRFIDPERLPLGLVHAANKVQSCAYHKALFFTKTIGGRKCVLLLTGESHIKDNKSASAHASLTNYFDRIGKEGAQNDGLMGKLFDIFYIRQYNPLQGTWLRSRRYGAGTHSRRECVLLAVDKLYKQMERAGTHLAVENVDRHLFHFNNTKMSGVDIATGNLTADGHRFSGLSVIKQLKRRILGIRQPQQPMPEIELEHGYVSSICGDIGKFCVNAWAVTLASIPLLCFLPPGNLKTISALVGASTLMLSVAGYLMMYAAEIFNSEKPRFKDSWKTPLICRFDATELVERDERMARNISAVFEEEGAPQSFMATCGLAHVKGITAWLTGEHGWKALELPKA